MNETDDKISIILKQIESYANDQIVGMRFGYNIESYELVINKTNNLSQDLKLTQLTEGLTESPQFDLVDEIYRAIHLDWLDVLKWFATNGFDINKAHGIVNHLSAIGNVRILQWMLENDLIREYDEYAFEMAWKTTLDDCLNWWMISGLKLKYSADMCIGFKSINRCKWYFDHNLNFNIENFCHAIVNEKDSIQKLDLLYEHCQKRGLKIASNNSFIDIASGYGRIDLIEWWISHGLELSYTTNALENACGHPGHYAMVKWWIDSGLQLKYNAESITDAIIESGNVQILSKKIYTNLTIFK
jgi:hypothetical protein